MTPCDSSCRPVIYAIVFSKAHSLLLNSIVTHRQSTWCTWMYELITKRWCSVLGYKNYPVIFGLYSFFVRVVFRSNSKSRIGQFTPSSSPPPPWLWPVDNVSFKICAFLEVRNMMSPCGMFQHPLSFSQYFPSSFKQTLSLTACNKTEWNRKK